MTPTRFDRPRRLSFLFLPSAVILSTLSPCQFLCVSVWIVAIVHMSMHSFKPRVCLSAKVTSMSVCFGLDLHTCVCVW